MGGVARELGGSVADAGGVGVGAAAVPCCGGNELDSWYRLGGERYSMGGVGEMPSGTRVWTLERRRAARARESGRCAWGDEGWEAEHRGPGGAFGGQAAQNAGVGVLHEVQEGGTVIGSGCGVEEDGNGGVWHGA